MKTPILTLILIISVATSYSQDSNKNFDFIIEIDDRIVSGSVSLFQLRIGDESDKNLITGGYYPGNLSIRRNDYTKLMSDTTNKIFIKFNYYAYELGKQRVYNYEIEFVKSWLSSSYNILRIYNLDKKRYKDQFDPIGKDKNYTYELESPSNTFLRIRHKKKK